MNGCAVLEFVVVAVIVIVAFRVRARKHAGGRKIIGGNTSISLKPTEIVIGGSIHTLEGVRAELAPQSKGRTTNNVLVVTGPNWSKSVTFRDIARANLAAREINEAAAQAAA